MPLHSEHIYDLTLTGGRGRGLLYSEPSCSRQCLFIHDFAIAAGHDNRLYISDHPAIIVAFTVCRKNSREIFHYRTMQWTGRSESSYSCQCLDHNQLIIGLLQSLQDEALDIYFLDDLLVTSSCPFLVAGCERQRSSLLPSIKNPSCARRAASCRSYHCRFHAFRRNFGTLPDQLFPFSLLCMIYLTSDQRSLLYSF